VSGTLLVVALVRCGRSVAVYVRAHGYGLREGGGIGRGGRHFGVNQTDSAYLVDNGCKKGGRDCQATMRVWKTEVEVAKLGVGRSEKNARKQDVSRKRRLPMLLVKGKDVQVV